MPLGPTSRLQRLEARAAEKWVPIIDVCLGELNIHIYYIILYYTMCYAMLYYTILYYTMFYYIILYYIMLYCVTST